MNILGVIMMMVIFVSVLLGGHFFIYLSLVRFFTIESNSIKIYLALGLFLLSISFIASSVVAHYGENIFTRAIYFYSGLWLAIGWNLILFFGLAWIAVWISKMFGWSFDHGYLAYCAILFASILSGYGIWCAYNPMIKNVTVQIKNLPQEWSGKTAVQLSDVHLGHVYGKDFLAKIVGMVNAQDPSIVFITGDLFDGMDGRLEELVGPLNDIKAPDGTYFITGNHETYLGVGESLSVLRNTPVKVLNDAVADVDGMQILGISYPQRNEKINLADAIRKVEDFHPEDPSILLYHNPAEATHAKSAGIGLQLSGHTHKGQLFPFQFITRLIYGKYHYGLSIDGDFSIYTSDGIGTWGPTMRTSGRPEIVIINFKQ